VYVALLQRKGWSGKYRIEALEGLAKIRNTDTLTELIVGITSWTKRGDFETGPPGSWRSAGSK